jgi:putative ABC transport system permease protein
MSMFTMVLSYLRARPMSTALNIVLMSLGISVITLLISVGHQLESQVTRNSKGIDLVVGAKGSPLQIILCAVYHVDFPTGNIRLADAERLSRNRLVKKAIPLALGDSYKNFRIVGTDTSYVSLYDATLASGAWWQEDLEVVVGSHVSNVLGLKAGDTFNSAHGLSADGTAHEEHPYKVVGVMAAGGTVVDNLILTNVSSIWEVHGSHSNTQRKTSGELSPLIPGFPAGDSTREITALLIKYRNPLAAIQLPRMINSMTFMQAASPAFETARLYTILGTAVDALTVLSAVLIAISALSIFLALYNSLRERRYDLAMMRAMGASRSKLFAMVVLEGSVLTLAGSVVGLLLGHFVLALLPMLTGDAASGGFSASVFYVKELYLLLGSAILGILCSLIPAVEAYRTDIHSVLAGN